MELPTWWGEGDYLRYASTNQLDAKKMIEQVDVHLFFLKQMREFVLSEGAAKLLENGNVYIGGRDKDGVPSLVFSMNG